MQYTDIAIPDALNSFTPLEALAMAVVVLLNGCLWLVTTGEGAA